MRYYFEERIKKRFGDEKKTTIITTFNEDKNKNCNTHESSLFSLVSFQDIEQNENQKAKADTKAKKKKL